LKNLNIKAGPTAKKILKDRGLRPQDIRVIPAAAGGPKWMTLHPLYKFIFGEWLPQSDQRIKLIGASAGAWSMACAAQSQPIAAFEKYLKGYAEQKYPTAPTPEEISENCNSIIYGLLGEKGITEILKPKRYNLNVITSPSIFPYKSSNLKRKLFTAAFWNLISRKNLGKYFERNVFSVAPSQLVLEDEIPTKHIQLNKENIHQALLASGAIPTIIAPIIIDNKVHWDGGITDYHLDLKYNADDGIVLYPHFHKEIIPGWLDKYVRLRKSSVENHHRTVLVYPSDEFINSLPGKKIPTRDDFKTYFKKDDRRIEMWYKSISRCEELADEFKTLVSQPIAAEDISDF